MLTLFELFGAVFLFIWCGNSVTTPLFSALHPCKKHISGFGMPLIAAAKIIKKHFLAHLMLFVNFQ